MRTVCFINIPAKRFPPPCVMHPDIIVKRHPVRNWCSVPLPSQCRIALLIRNSVNPRRRIKAPRGIARHEIGFQNQLTLHIQKQMLRRQINLHVRIAVVWDSMHCSGLIIRWCAFSALAVLNHFRKFRRFLLRIHPPAVIALVNCDIYVITGLKCARFKNRIIIFPQILHEIRYLCFVQGNLCPVHLNPCDNRITVKHFLFVPKGIRDGNIRVFLQIRKSRL